MVFSLERWNGKVAVVTGAGSGIGAATAKKLLDEGLQVVAVDVREEFLVDLSKKLQDKKGELYTFTVDINQEKEVVELFKKITDEIGPVHILINSAGIIQQTSLTDGDVEKWRKVFDVNVIGLSIMTREAVRVMRANQIDGHIVNICSREGHRVLYIPGLNVYSASKHAVKALSESLRQEFNHMGLKIKITNLSPGSVSTSIAQNNNFQFGEKSKSLVSGTPVTIKPVDIANGILYVLSTPPEVQVEELTISPVGSNR